MNLPLPQGHLTIIDSGKLWDTNRVKVSPVTFFLDGWAAFAPDCAGDATSEDQLGVGSIHDGIDVHVGDVALHQRDFFPVDDSFHGKL